MTRYQCSAGVPKYSTSNAPAPKKCTKWQFVIASLFRDCDQKDTDDASDQRSYQTRSSAFALGRGTRRPLPSSSRRPGPCLRGRADGNIPRPRSRASRCPPTAPSTASANDSTGRGGGKSNQRLDNHSAVPSIGFVKKLKSRPAPSAEEINFVRKDSFAQIGDRQHDEHGRENGPFGGLHRQAERRNSRPRRAIR